MNFSKIVKIGLIILFTFCLFDMPYGYFQFVRFFGMIGFIILFKIDEYNKRNYLKWIWIISAILINPFFKIGLGRIIWNLIDVIWIIILIYELIIRNYKNIKIK